MKFSRVPEDSPQGKVIVSTKYLKLLRVASVEASLSTSKKLLSTEVNKVKVSLLAELLMLNYVAPICSVISLANCTFSKRSSYLIEVID